ncbi:hypothetical protein ABIE65_003987 [Constrictibacter sp. MBR-5]|uniref:DUF2232 domain-containing protein n=1 Tax=Constrictibacter sp. MBR-5 TaxID=3156467 RepID=UPI003396363C
MPRSVLLALAGGAASGLLYLALMTGTMGGTLFAYLSQVPLFLIGFGLGLSPAVTAGVLATVVVAAAGSVYAGLLFVATSVAPLLVIVRQALLNRPAPDGTIVWYPPGHLIALLSGMAAAGILAAALAFGGGEDGLRAGVRDTLDSALQGMMQAGMDEAERRAFADSLAGFFPGAIGVSWIVMMTVNGSLAQGVLSGFGRNIRPSPPLAELVLPVWPYYALGACLLFAIVASGTVGYIAGNLAIVFAVPFFLQGLGVVHALANRVSARTLSLSIFYLVLIVSGWPALVVTVAGLLEPFAKLRLRYGRPRGPEEE